MTRQTGTLALLVCALVAAGPASATDYNDDYGGGSWNSPTSWNPSDVSYPQSGDTATLDSEKITVNINLSGNDTPDEIILDGGEMFLYYRSRTVYGAISVKSDSTISGDIAVDKWTAQIQAPISDKVIATVTHTGVLTKTGVGFVGVYANNMGFSGGWAVNEGRLKVAAAGGLGTGTVNVNSGGELYFSADHGAGQMPSAIHVNAGGAVLMQASLPQETLIPISGGSFVMPGGCVYPGSIDFTAATTNTVSGDGVGSYTSPHITGTVTGPASTTVNFYRAYDAYHEFMELGGNNEAFLSDIHFHGPGGYVVTHPNALGTNTPGAGTVTVHADAKALELQANLGRDISLDGSVLASYGGTRTYYGALTLTDDSTIAGRGANPNIFIITGTVTEDGTPRVVTFDMQGNNTKDRAYVELHNPGNDWSGGTEINGYMYSRVEVKANGALGRGTVNVNGSVLYTTPAATGSCVLASLPRVNVQGGTLRLKSDESIAKGLAGPIHIHAGGGLWIESAATTPTFGGAGQNFQLYDGAILDNATVLATITPTKAQITGGNQQVYKGLRADFTGEESFGPDGSALYAGLATISETNFSVTGTMNENTAGNGFSLWTQLGRTITFNGAGLNATGTVVLKGKGHYNFSGAGNFHGTADTVDMEATGRVYFDSTNGLASGVTLNVNNGRLEVANGTALENSSQVNLNGAGSGGIFYVNQALTTGSVKVVGSAGVHCSNAAGLNPAVFDWSAADGAHLTLGADNITDLPTNGKVNFVLNSSSYDNFTETITLADDTRLTTAAGAGATKLNSNCSLAATGDVARVCARGNTTMTLDCDFDLAGKTLVLGDTEAFKTLHSSGTQWGDATQDGLVYLSSNSTGAIGAIDVVAGDVQIHGAAKTHGARWVRAPEGSIIYTHYSGHYDATFRGTCTVRDNQGRVLYFKGGRVGGAAGGAHMGGISPGMDDGDVGVIQFDSSFSYHTFETSADFGGGDYEHPRVTIDVLGDGGVAGTDHDQVYLADNLHNLNLADLKVVLRAPSAALKPAVGTPTPVLGGNMTIIKAATCYGGDFRDMTLDAYDSGGAAVEAAIAAHWAMATSTADAVTVTGGDVVLHGSSLLWTAHKGDADLNDEVDVLDIVKLANNFQREGAGVNWTTADLDLSGKVDVLDLVIIANNFGWKVTGGGDAGAPVPEPASLAVLALGAALIRRRRR